jgi:hypothetical protein
MKVATCGPLTSNFIPARDTEQLELAQALDRFISVLNNQYRGPFS